jgi:hypothetical protein
MPGSAGTLEQLAKELGAALSPLQTLDASNVIAVLRDLGVEFPASLTGDTNFMTAVSDAATSASSLAADTQALIAAITAGDDSGILGAGVKVIDDIGSTIATFGALATALKAVPPSAGLSSAQIAAFAGSLADDLLAYLLVGYLEAAYPTLACVLTLFGVFDRTVTPGKSGDPTQPPHVARKLHLAKLLDLLTSPAQLLKDTVNWGDPAFDGTALLQRVNDALDGVALPVTLVPAAPAPPKQLVTPFFSLGVDSSISPPGLLLTLTAATSAPVDVSLQLSPNWALNITASAPLDTGLKVQVRPPGSFSVKPPTNPLSGQILFDLRGPGGGSPILIFGETGKSRMEVATVDVGVGVSVTWDAAANVAGGEPSLDFSITGGQLFIDMSEADGFLSDVTGGTPIQATFGFDGTWAPSTGLHITGGGQLEIDLPLHLDLGPVTLSTIYIIGGISGGDLTLELSAALGVTLGPIQASVDRVGLTGTLSFPQSGGNLGPANLALGFKPPDGLGIEIDAGPAAGGGYISFDPSKGQYAGVLDVSLMDVVQVKVIGVIDTIMPDGSSGFSFILIITFDLPPLQLGFGFTLNGVGGLGGVNRTIDTAALQAGFVAHSLDSILFPPNPVANAPEIISNIRNFFPVAQNSYVFGPMMEIGWGTPTLITLQIGVVLELPQPVVIVLLGLVEVALPDSETALIELNIDLLGELDFGTKTLQIEGDLYDSSVLIYSMTGSLFFRICWGSEPNFIYSCGGFNPHYNTAGLDIPPMQRCSVSIGDGDNPRISANNYFAVSSNSLQFGANVQAYASAAGFTIQGYLGFDVLIIFSPFSFEFDFSVSFSVSFEGFNLLSLGVSGSLSGPRPWNFNGSASISILFFSVSVSLSLTWGDSTPVTIPQKRVLPDLVTALQAHSNWSAALPSGVTPAASLAALAPSDPTVLVYPMGTLSVRENIVPLDVPITRYGNATPSDGSLFAISDVQINNQETTRNTFQEYFAPGQFNALSDADKLSSPSFELYDAGVTIGSDAVDSGKDTARTVVYEERYIDSPMSYSRSTGHYLMPVDISAALSRQGAGFVAPVRNSGLGKYAAGPATAAMTTSEESYVVANTNDLSVRSDISSASGVTYFQARAALNFHLAANPADTGDLQIVTLYEAAA